MKKLNNISEENKYNILLIITDQERNNEWIPKSVNLPGRERLKSRSLSFNNHYTHTSPCSPSRATIFTGKYIHQHGVKENSSTNNNTQLNTGYLTLGKSLKDLGYYTAYKGKWHLQSKPQPQMEEFGFADWFGNDMFFWGLPNSGTEYDPLIYKETYQWLKNHSHDKKPYMNCSQITKSLSSHIDLARTIIDLAGGSDHQLENFEGKSLTRLLNDPSKTARNSVYFAQEWPWYPGVEKVRYANTGYFDGKINYSRYYGIGGGVTNLGLKNNKKMRVTKDSKFDDFEHELYDLSVDPYEINNIGYKRNSNKKYLKRYFNNLNELESSL